MSSYLTVQEISGDQAASSGGFRRKALKTISRSEINFNFFQQKRLKNKLILSLMSFKICFVIMIASHNKNARSAVGYKKRLLCRQCFITMVYTVELEVLLSER